MSFFMLHAPCPMPHALKPGLLLFTHSVGGREMWKLAPTGVTVAIAIKHLRCFWYKKTALEGLNNNSPGHTPGRGPKQTQKQRRRC